MPSYISLLVIALTASVVSPVRCAEPLQIEDREHTPGQASSVEKRFDPFHPVVLMVAFTTVLAAIGIGMTFDGGDGGQKHNAVSTPPTNPANPTATPSTNHTQPTNPPRAFVAGQEPARDHSGLPVDTATNSSEAGSVNNQDRRTSSSPDLFSRANLDEALILFSRMLDKLD